MNNGTPVAVVTDYRGLEFHEVCCLFPSFTDEQLEETTRSIGARGIDQKIVLWRGRIIDGRNRFIAACNANHPFTADDFREWDGEEDDLLDYVWEINAKCRRHLKPNQLDAIGVQIMEIKAAQIERGRRKNASTENHGKFAINNDACDSVRHASKEAAEKVGRSERQIREAARVKKASPEKFDEIKKGKKTVHKAKKELGLAPGKHEVPLAPGSKAKKTVIIPENPTDIAAVIEEHEERVAIRDQDSDESWVEQLDPYKVLQGKLRDDFAYAAVAARHLQPARRVWAQAVGSEMKGNRKTPPWFRAHVKALEQLPPDQWHVCPEQSEGGCKGLGKIEFVGECPKCWGNGYLVRQ